MAAPRSGTNKKKVDEEEKKKVQAYLRFRASSAEDYRLHRWRVDTHSVCLSKSYYHSKCA